MSTTKFIDLSPEVLPYLKADPSSPLIESAIKAAVIDFCNDSWVWKHFPDMQDLTAGESTYDLEPAPNADITTVLSVSVDGKAIQSRSPDQLDDLIPKWKTETGKVEFFTQINTEQIILARVPDITVVDGIVMTLALQPRRASSSFPRWISSQYIYDLAAGALARLMLMPERPWTNLKAGAMYLERFQNAVSDAKNSAVKGLARAPTRTTSQH